MGRKKWETQPAVQMYITKVSDELGGGVIRGLHGNTW